MGVQAGIGISLCLPTCFTFGARRRYIDASVLKATTMESRRWVAQDPQDLGRPRKCGRTISAGRVAIRSVEGLLFPPLLVELVNSSLYNASFGP